MPTSGTSPTASSPPPPRWTATAGGGRAPGSRIVPFDLASFGRCCELVALRVHRVDQLPFQQMERRPPVELDVVERVGGDLREPHEPGLHVFQEEEMHGAEEESAEAHDEPDLAD